MKDFDEEFPDVPSEQRTFRIRGETFVRRDGVKPEAIIRWEETDLKALSSTEALKIADETVLDFIEDTDGGHARYRALRERAENPLTLSRVNALVTWLWEQETRRPTEAPSASTDSPEPNGTESTGTSSSPVALVSTG